MVGVREACALARIAIRIILLFYVLTALAVAIHDASRLDELGLTIGTDAFLTLEQTANNEGLFDDKLFVAEVDHSEGFKVIRRIEGRLAGNENFAAVGLVLSREGTEDAQQ